MEYNITISNKAIPADLRASLTRLTVKKRTITWGSPAVPTIKANVIAKTSTKDLDPCVYSAKPKSLLKPSNLSNKKVPDPSTNSLPKPNCGMGFPVI